MTAARPRLRQWIERSHLDQNEAARLLQLQPSALSQLLNDQERMPSLVTAVRIERLTGISVEAWLDFAEFGVAL